MNSKAKIIHLFKIRGAKTEVFCCLRFRIFEAKILVCAQDLGYEPLKLIRALTVKSKFGQKVLQTSDLTVKALITLDS